MAAPYKQCPLIFRAVLSPLEDRRDVPTKKAAISSWMCATVDSQLPIILHDEMERPFLRCRFRRPEGSAFDVAIFARVYRQVAVTSQH